MRHIMHYTASLGFVIRKFTTGGGAAALLMAGGGSPGLVRRPSLLRTALLFAFILLLPMALLALSVSVMHVASVGVVLAFPAVATAPKSGTEPKKPAKIREMENELKSLAKELEAGQTEMAAGPITSERGEELEAKAKEMEELQDNLDRYNRIAGVVRKSREVERVTLPGEDGHVQGKTIHTTPGHLFVASEAFRKYRSEGKSGWSSKVSIGQRLGKKVRLRGEEAVAFEKKAYDAATLSDLGTDAIIEVDRDRELVRYEEPEILTIRDVLNIVPTGSDSIRYVKHTVTERAAESQNPRRGGTKPYLRVEFEPTTVAVETIAVLSKVTEQDIDDAPRLVGFINGEMTLDVRVEEERQLLWGTGLNGQIKGLFVNQGVPEFDRAGVEDTVIDIIRKMRTDLRKKRVNPTFTTIDPLDWEAIELAKGSDDRYIWGLITDLRGPRIWSLRVVESDAMTNLDTGERRVMVGDGVRGATVYDRNAIQLAVGFVDDDFARNLRTLRAEERLALAVKRAYAFEYAVTVAGES